MQPGFAFLVGFFAGATVPFVTYLLDGRLFVDDATGIVVSSGIRLLSACCASVSLPMVWLAPDGR